MTVQIDLGEVACSLSDEEKRARRALARRTLIPHIIETQEIEHGLKLVFLQSEEVQSNVEAFVRMERECCTSLTFTITPPGEALTLMIEGPPEASAIIESFIAQIQGH